MIGWRTSITSLDMMYVSPSPLQTSPLSPSFPCPPATGLRLDDSKWLLRPVVYAADDGRTDAQKVACSQPIRHHWCECLPDQVGHKGHCLPVRGGGCWRSGVEDRTLRRDDLQWVEATISHRHVRISNRLEDGSRRRDRGYPGRID